MPPRTSVPPQRGMTKEVFGCPWFRVHEEGWNDFSDLDRQPFYRIESSDGVLVLAMTRNEEIILVRQFRQALRRNTIECPAGSIEDGESPEEAAARELYEETRYRAGTLRLLGSGHIMMNRYSAKDFLFMAQDCEVLSQTPEVPDQNVLLVSPQEFKRLVTSGDFEHIPALSLFSLVEWQFGLRLVV
ncbi:MAG: NUDIX hydrolase [Nitrospirales bacterium]|nr:NUDIX hydrolase [Nitrospirales bacterium]